jgi:hypothetical protein
MIISRVLHQQIFQLKWHVLACVALIMVLPLEEAAVNLHAGDGFFSSRGTGAALLLAPLLAGLIACANVQADMDEKRYLFWRSKPVSMAAIVPLKYVAGLIMGLLIIVCPMLFSVVSVKLYAGHRADALDKHYMMAISVISCLAYSICFLTNVLVRQTARAWLIGMTMTCFVLLAPFILPLGILDIVSDMAFLRASRAYLSITLGMALLAFILAVLAVKQDWHLRTNLRGLLWAGAGLIFGLMLLLSGQIANIRILDEKTIDKSGPGYYLGGRLEKQGDNTVVPSQMGSHGGHQITIDGHQISLDQIKETPTESTRAQVQAMAPRFAVSDDLLSKPYYEQGVYHEIGSELYFVAIRPYYIEKEVTDRYGEPKTERYWKKLYLRSFRIVQGLRIPQSSLDLSDCIVEERQSHASIRKVKDNLIAIVFDRQCMTVELSDQGDLKQIEQKTMKTYSRFMVERERPFKLPMVPLDSLDITDRIKLTVDLNYIRHWNFRNGLNDSLVQIHKDQISFALVSKKDVARYDVINWDQENIYCRFRDARAFAAFLEQRSDIWEHSPYFVQNGNLYAYDWRTLMVFDISSDRSIRKLGHFERISTRFAINDIKVEEDGRILMLAETNQRYSEEYVPKYSLYLLDNPQ